MCMTMFCTQEIKRIEDDWRPNGKCYSKSGYKLYKRARTRHKRFIGLENLAPQ